MRRRIAGVQAAADELMGIVVSSLNWSDLERAEQTLTIEPVHVGDACADAIGEAQRRPSSVRRTIVCKDLDVEVLANATRLREAFYTLLCAAERDLPRNGQLEVRGSFSADGRWFVTLVGERDPSGMRLPRSYRHTRPASTLELTDGSTPLRFVNYLVDRMQGRFDVIRAESRGHVFRVWLPTVRPIRALGSSARRAIGTRR